MPDEVTQPDQRAQLDQRAQHRRPEPVNPLADTADLPAGFVWGSATASYQIEGAVGEGGRGPSIWDTFSHTPGKVLDGDTGDVADDHYHRYAEDIALMTELGLDAYRFSISWPRVQPGGRGEFNAEGIAFYRRLATALREAGITPVCTLYHWDLPQELEDAGGWTNRATALAFEQYAAQMARQLGDLVDTWTTLNEPWCTAFLGYAAGIHAPGRRDAAATLAAVHHLNLAHGLAVRAIRGVLGERARCSVTLNLHLVRPDDPAREADVEAARQADTLGNGSFLGPMLSGAYPPELFEDTAGITDWPWIEAGDLDVIRQRIDVLGINYYSTYYARGNDAPAGGSDQGGADAEPSPWIGRSAAVDFVDRPGPHTAMGWLVEPAGLTDLLERVHLAYPDVPLMVTENGAAYEDVVSADGAIHDAERVDYLREHIGACTQAVRRGVDLRGYFVWSLLDNFEWSFGYSKRFGIVRVDYDTQLRTVKDSGRYYALVIQQHRAEQATAR